jgi:hypothetical protein
MFNLLSLCFLPFAWLAVCTGRIRQQAGEPLQYHFITANRMTVINFLPIIYPRTAVPG